MPPMARSRPSSAWNTRAFNWKTLTHLFTTGDVDKAQSEVREVVEYARKAADAASSSGKHLKETEIKLRKVQERMHDIGESLSL